MPFVPETPGNGVNIATNTIARDSVTEHMQLVNVADPVTGLSVTTVASPSTVAVTTTSISVLASNGARRGATIYNTGSVPVLIEFGATASASAFTNQIYGNGYYEVPFGYKGAISAITASGSSSLNVREMT